MRKLLLFFSFLISFSLTAQSIKLSVYSEVSIVTVGPGNELFTAFGHTAIHIKDPLLKFDTVFNYGMFDFNQPNFYLNFAEGKLLYKLGAYPFPRFISQNAYEKRWVKEQVLNLNQQQRQAVFEFLVENLKPKNASYLYDPFYDNCATKPIEILQKLIPNISLNDDFVNSKKSIRSLMNDELNQNTWGSFGINLALGNKIDRESSLKDYMYLPDFVYESIQKATIKVNGENQPLVKEEKKVLKHDEIKTDSATLNPFLIFGFLLLIGIFVSYKDFKSKKVSNWFDFTLLAITGLVGVGITFLWFFTNHATTPNNFNILWCFPMNALAFVFYKNKKLLKKYFIFLVILICLVPIIWLTKIQEFNVYMIPMILVLALRYLTQIQLLSSKQ